MTEQNDSVDRKLKWGSGTIKEFFGYVKEDVKSFLIVILVIAYFVKDYQVTLLNRELVNKVETLLRERLPGAVQKEVSEQIKPIAESVDTTKSNVDKFIERISK